MKQKSSAACDADECEHELPLTRDLEISIKGKTRHIVCVSSPEPGKFIITDKVV